MGQSWVNCPSGKCISTSFICIARIRPLYPAGLFSFFAIPILLGDITLDFMSMIDININVNNNNSSTTINNTNNNNNNNNNNNGGTSTSTTTTGTGNNNNNNNNNGRRRRDNNFIEGGANDLFGIKSKFLCYVVLHCCSAIVPYDDSL